MELVIAVTEDLAGQASALAAVRAITDPAGVQLVQRFQGADDPLLTRWFSATVADAGQAEALAGRLRQLVGVVQEAFVKGAARPPMLPPDEVGDRPPGPPPPNGPTPPLPQGYLGPAPEGISAEAAWAEPGGDGEGVDLVDVEIAWELKHEKVVDRHLTCESMGDDPAYRNHGTSVLGILVAAPDGRGITGICPGAAIEVVSMRGDEESTDDATYQAAKQLGPGDVLLLELERRSGPDDGDSRGYLPVEWWPDEFDVIRSATGRGVIVVEAAANGGVDLDRPPERDPGLRNQVNPFLRGTRDSRAIIVGAGAPPSSPKGPDRSRLEFSNYGACVDAQGWGSDVTTSGGYLDHAGDILGGDDPKRWYTASFNGTSAAAPMVAGALACVQGILKASGPRPLTPREARHALRMTGWEQVASAVAPLNQRIGNRPDLEQLIPFAKRLAEHPPDHHLQTQPRRQGMKITITIEDGHVAVDGIPPAGPAGNRAAPLGSTVGPSGVDVPHVRGPRLAIENQDGSVQRFVLVEDPEELVSESLDTKGYPEAKSAPEASS